jgi:hypothetical protein
MKTYPRPHWRINEAARIHAGQPRMKTDDSVWTLKGATLSDKTAQKEFGLTFEEIVEGIRAGKLQYRKNSIYGSPFLRLIRQEVEALVNEKYGRDYLKKKQLEERVGGNQQNLEATEISNAFSGREKSGTSETFRR